MARLPRSPIAVDVGNNYRPVQEARASGNDPVGAALQNAGNATFELGERMATAKINADMTKAAIRLRSKLDAARREIENDMESDPATFEARFRERASQIANEEAGTLSSPAGRKAFGLKAQEDVEDYSIRMRDVTRRRQVENVKADTMQAGAEYELLAKDPAQPRELLDASRADYDALIDRQVSAGIYTPDEAAAAKIASAEVYRSGVTTRHLTNVDAMLDAGRYGEAEEYFKANYGEIDPAQRARAEEVLQEKVREGQAITKADALWSEAGGDYAAFIAKARETKNPEERLALEARGAQLKAQDEAAQAAVQDRVINDALMAITAGKPVPPSVMRAADGKTRDFIQDQLRQRAAWAAQGGGSASMSELSKANLRELQAQLIGPEGQEVARAGLNAVLADPFVKARFDNMGPDEQGQFILDVQKAAQGGAADDVTTAYKSVVALAGVYMPDLGKKKGLFSSKPLQAEDVFTGIGEGDPGVRRVSANRQKSDLAVKVEGLLLKLVDEEVRRTGSPKVDTDRAKQLLALAFAEAGSDPETGQTKYPISRDIAGGIVETDMRRAALDFRAAHPLIWSKVSAAYPGEDEAFILEKARQQKLRLDTQSAISTVGSIFGARKEGKQ